MPKQVNYPKVKEVLKSFYSRKRRLPSFSELQKLLRYQSKGGVSRLIKNLVAKQIIIQDKAGKLLPTPFLEGGIKLLGTIQAGFPSPAEEELIDTISLDEYFIRRPEASYLVKVTGDSMIEAGIHPNDLVVVERGRQAKSGDIVIAQIDGEWTMKTYLKRGKQVVLAPANKKYSLIRPSSELIIGGVVVACLRKYKH